MEILDVKDARTHANEMRIKVVAWFDTGVVLVWHWCGTGVVWCGVVLVWFSTGVVLV